MKLPLEGITVLEFSQYLAGPYAGLRLADLGARVIKIERPGGGDACRSLATRNMWADGDSVLFHTINRNKESFAADLKNPDDLAKVKRLVAKADIITHNFRPGIMERLGLDHAGLKAIKSDIIYGEVSGYGSQGPWKDKPGQDLLAQSLSGLTWVTGNDDQPPTPFGIAVADMICGNHLAQGLLAALVQKRQTGKGTKVAVSLMESILDFQFEGLTAFLNSGENQQPRSAVANAHPWLGAPYGIYPTADGHIALSMASLKEIGDAIGCTGLEPYLGSARLQFEARDTIKRILAKHLGSRTTSDWLTELEPRGFWCSDVLDYDELTRSDAYKALHMELSVARPGGTRITTTRCPIRLNGNRLSSGKAAPALGEATTRIQKEMAL